jgi:hypothetical protein
MTIEKADSIRRPPHNPALPRKLFLKRSRAIFLLSGLSGIKVRIVNMGGDPWFIAKDVCAALEIVDHKVPCAD